MWAQATENFSRLQSEDDTRMSTTKSPGDKVCSQGASVWNVFREGARFFMNEGDVHKTFQRLAKILSDAKID